MPSADDFSFIIDFSKLTTKTIQQLCQIDSSVEPTPELWVSMTVQVTNELYAHLKPAHVKRISVDIDHPYMITVHLPYDHAVKAQNLLVRYLRTRKLTF